MTERLENLAVDFFKKFARCEWALKDGGFHKGNDKGLEANCEGFAISVENTLSEQSLSEPAAVELKKAVNRLNDPSQKQYIDNNGNLEFRLNEPDHKSRADLILLYIR